MTDESKDLFPIAKEAVFSTMMRIEPRLKIMREEVKALARVHKRSNAPFCAKVLWQKYFDPYLCELVGHGSDVPMLNSSRAYDAAFFSLYSLLPDCRDCDCTRQEAEILIACDNCRLLFPRSTLEYGEWGAACVNCFPKLEYISGVELLANALEADRLAKAKAAE